MVLDWVTGAGVKHLWTRSSCLEKHLAIDFGGLATGAGASLALEKRYPRASVASFIAGLVSMTGAPREVVSDLAKVDVCPTK
jgi:hypothetical protein